MAETDINPPYDLFSVTVTVATLITPRLKRITVCALNVPGLRSDLPGQYVKVFVRGSDGLRQAGRAYTIRRFNPRTGEAEFDFVLHGDAGNISTWAARAGPGDTLEISKPNLRSGTTIHPEVKNYFLLADETGLPAVSAILETLPPTAAAQVFIETENTGEIQSVDARSATSVRWLCREFGETLADAAKGLSIPSGSVVWVAAESNQVSAIRAELKKERFFDTCVVHASGYWKKGVADHRDPD